MEKFDVKASYPQLYAQRSRDFALVQAPRLQYLAIDGHGDPNTSAEYGAAVQCLYPTAYALKFQSRKELGRDYAVGPLEALWRAADMEVFTRREKDSWDWTLLVFSPEWITEESLAQAVAAVGAKKGLPGLEALRLATLEEGLCAQILHVGAYDDEAPVLARLHHDWMPSHGLTFNGDHHEVYLNDPRRTAPEKLRTILRQPVRQGTADGRAAAPEQA